jgi:hypothetical protein
MSYDIKGSGGFESLKRPSNEEIAAEKEALLLLEKEEKEVEQLINAKWYNTRSFKYEMFNSALDALDEAGCFINDTMEEENRRENERKLLVEEALVAIDALEDVGEDIRDTIESDVLFDDE